MTYLNHLNDVFAWLKGEPGQEYLHTISTERISLEIQKWYSDKYECPFNSASLRVFAEKTKSGFLTTFEDSVTKEEFMFPSTFPLHPRAFENSIADLHEAMEEWMEEYGGVPEEDDALTDEENEEMDEHLRDRD